MKQQFLTKWLLFMACSLLVTVTAGLTNVWLSLERSELVFQIGEMQTEVSRRAALQAKLEVERDKWRSPAELERKAKSLGMRKASPGQIRTFFD